MSVQEKTRVIDLNQPTSEHANDHCHILMRHEDLEIIRLTVRAGEQKPEDRAPGPALLQCLKGKVAVLEAGQTHLLEAGQIMCFSGGELHSLRGLEDATLLLTLRPQWERTSPRVDLVQETSEDSFPASDAPSWTPTTSLGGPAH